LFGVRRLIVRPVRISIILKPIKPLLPAATFSMRWFDERHKRF
jgi:hypothetical protein